MTYTQLLQHFNLWAQLGLAQKHSTHDSIFFIRKEDQGFKPVKFYNNGIDYREGSYSEGLAEAYNEAVLLL